jgi:hypothetical protein
MANLTKKSFQRLPVGYFIEMKMKWLNASGQYKDGRKLYCMIKCMIIILKYKGGILTAQKKFYFSRYLLIAAYEFPTFLIASLILLPGT